MLTTINQPTNSGFDFLDFGNNDTSNSGFRLSHLEFYNWGTFNDKIWKIKPNCNNALLTGDIGSGKSTIVDAITTLLVPHHKIVYNRAAGAESKERNLYSYIRGEYKNAQDGLTQSSKAIALRDENAYTVIAGYFYNANLLQGVTIAQVFWLKDGNRNPERFFIVAQTELSIAVNFSQFGDSILKLRKKLLDTPHVQLFDHFKEYNSKFRQLFGIQNEQALDLFYQTISMKSIGNLTEFVRSHMLEKSDIVTLINEMLTNFENLNRAHESILKAKNQIELLNPIVEYNKKYEVSLGEVNNLIACRNGLDGYIAKHKIKLLTDKINKLLLEIQKNEQSITITRENIEKLSEQIQQLRNNIDENGGRRLHELATEIERQTKELTRKQHNANQYDNLVKKLSFSPLKHENDFINNKSNATHTLATCETQLNQIQEQITTVKIDLKVIHDEEVLLKNEIKSLKARNSNIPTQMLNLREKMLNALITANIKEEDIPFVGELLQVNDAKWSGAIERVMHNFGLSMLVSDKHYKLVSQYVDNTDLRGKLVYYKVTQEKPIVQDTTHDDSIWNKLNIKPDSIFHDWLNNHIKTKFDYVCCEHLDDFHHYPQALSINGQIKNKALRHEKDDRYDIHDITRYVLGWTNKDKIKVLEHNLNLLNSQGNDLAKRLTIIANEQQNIINTRDISRDLLKFDDFLELYWQTTATQIQKLQQEKIELEKSSDILTVLKHQLEQTIVARNQENNNRDNLIGLKGANEQKVKDLNTELTNATICIDKYTTDEQTQIFPQLLKIQQEILTTKEINLHTINTAQTTIRTHIQKLIDSKNQQQKAYTEQIIQKMQTYKNTYPAETTEIDVNLNSAVEFSRILTQLQKEDLPRHETRFKTLLNEGTINSVALLQNQIVKERRDIENKIRTINLSLRDIEYSSGTYITLLADPVQDIEIKAFATELRNCLSNTLDNNSYYSEDKFLQIKALIDRFKGRAGFIDIDRKWMNKVIDVRNWFNFSASERWFNDNSEREFYSDSSGKSGGQKEKLAYTVLASALVYQFGLEYGVHQPRSFRFVVIDEAFGRGSDESTRYGLELFKRLNLQLLVVTPLQKIRTIEDYISAVHFVHNHDGCRSEVRNLTIEEYKANKLQVNLELKVQNRVEVPIVQHV